jgi:hypothetical protein
MKSINFWDTTPCSTLSVNLFACWFLAELIPSTPPERRLTLNGLHGVIFRMLIPLKFIIIGIFVLLHLEVTPNCSSDTSDKTLCVLLHFCVFGFYLPLINECTFPLEVVKLLVKHLELCLRLYLFILTLLHLFEHRILLVRESDS